MIKRTINKPVKQIQMSNKSKTILTFLLLFVLNAQGIFAQDTGFSQFYANLIYLNPGFAGTGIGPRFSLNYRNQWPGLDNPFSNYSASYDQYIDVLHGGVGLLVTNDTQGDGSLNHLQIAGTYGYTLIVSREFAINAALQAGYGQMRLNWDKLIFPDMIDPALGIVNLTGEVPFEQNKNYLDFSAGAVGFSKSFYFGASVHHIAQIGLKDYKSQTFTNPKYSVHFGTTIEVNKNGLVHQLKMTISPNLVYQRQAEFQQINYGFYVKWSSLITGFWMRHDLNFQIDAPIVLIGFEHKNIKFAYSYDFGIARHWTKTLGSHEVSLILQFEPYSFKKKKKPKAISCPSF